VTHIHNNDITFKKRQRLNKLLSFQIVSLPSSSPPLDGYHIQVRDLSDSGHGGGGGFDVVTISGGATRSHTLSDLRPNTKYEVFVVPYYKRIKGMPSNMKRATTKEDGED
jgi:hypothetical protein